jgi:LysR family transcriptional regulator, low CO2-responsive transcriptional regulator
MYQRWLAAFHVVARAGGFTAASKVLNVGQSTVSTHVRALEDHFGVELFLRKGRFIELTEIGRSLLTITHGLFGHEEEAVNLLRSARGLQAGALRLGAIGPFDVMELVAGFRSQYPKIQMSVAVGTASEILGGLLKFEIDIGVVGHEYRDPKFFSMPFNRHPVLVAVNSAHRLAKRRTIRIADLDGEDMVLRAKDSTTRAAFEQAVARSGIHIRPVMEINSREAVREAIIRGLGIGVVSEAEFVPHQHLRALAISDARMFIHAYVTCLAERQNRPLIAAFLKMAKSSARKTYA